MKKVWIQAAKAVACLALVATNISVLSACWWFFYQPELPQSLREE